MKCLERAVVKRASLLLFENEIEIFLPYLLLCNRDVLNCCRCRCCFCFIVVLFCCCLEKLKYS